LAYVSFFPQLVAGPIERAKHLLPQFQKQRSFDCDQAIDGLKQILWGLVKKLLIADACAPHVAEIFTNHQDYQGSTLLLGAILFAFQIYGDFSGYTDMAIGTARLFGFKLSKNFAYPYFSRDIAEFWRRWHISLTSWFKEYLYIPLGGSRCGTRLNVRNTFIVFIVSGLWHGANWTFIAWGAFNAMLFLPLLLTRKNKINQGTINQGSLIPSGKAFLQVGGTFFLTCIGWVFFRSETLTDAFQYLAGIASKSLFTLPEIRPRDLMLTLGLFTLIEWTQREHEYALRNIRAIIRPRVLRFCIYSAILIKVTLNPVASSTFIYFQF
jgi:D-alanyl-lipoteichoic acid acyltransferase DltB (MBOAT superfamily)